MVYYYITKRFNFLAMDKAIRLGHEVATCIVVRHLPRLYRSTNSSNGTNGSNSDIIDLHSDVYP